MTVDDVADSTDWLTTPLAGFAAVEAALRCQVCKDLYKTPMITTCSHTFCSLCIRRALSSEGKCPLCRAPEQEMKLRSNWSMEETVEAFSKARPSALELARAGLVSPSSPKRKAGEMDTVGVTEISNPTKRMRTSARLSNRSEPPPAPVEVVEESGDEEYLLENSDGLVPCPVCQKKMKEWQVFSHLESCPGPSAQSSRQTPRELQNNLSQAHRQQQRTLERLPALNYSMFKEQALRKKLSELGIANQGPRLLLERRHKEWITIWNANCDAATPRKRSELLHDLDIWERTQGGRAPTSGKAIQYATAIKDKDFDGSAWATKHENSFKDLIANAKRSRLAARHKTEESTSEESKEPASKTAKDMEISTNIRDTSLPVDTNIKSTSNNIVDSYTDHFQQPSSGELYAPQHAQSHCLDARVTTPITSNSVADDIQLQDMET